MSIIRSPRKAQDFTIIANSVCLDASLSMRALGLLVRLLSRPDNWQTNSDTLAREFHCGREQIRTVLRELQSAGYMALRKAQNELGHWSSHWYVFDTPELALVDAEQALEKKKTAPKAPKPKTGVPGPGKPYVGSSSAIPRTDLTRTDTKEEIGFASFWSAYPKKVAKPAALKAFKSAKVKGEELAAMLADIAARAASDDWQKEGGKYVPNPATYLNQRRWEDGQAPAAEKVRFV